MTIRVAGCFIHPVKGFPPVAVEALDLTPGASPAGDRAFAFVTADARIHDDGWVSKYDAATLISAPRLWGMRAAFDPASRRLTLTGPDGAVRTADVDDAAQRNDLAAWFQDVVATFERNPFKDHPNGAPLRLLGDGHTRFTDRRPIQVTLGSAASAAAFSDKAGMPVDIRRFRLNVVLEGAAPFQEFEWADRTVGIGETRLRITKRLKRCKAIEAAPDGSGRNLRLLDALDNAYGHIQFGVEAEVLVGGPLRVGDTLTIDAAS